MTGAADPPASAGTPDPAASAAEGVRFALGTLTVLPVRCDRWDRPAARRGMECAPLAGAVVGLAAAAAGGLLLLLGAGPLLAAVAGVAVPAALTRGLHLDGLADVADGLGSARPADEALRIMKRSDIGPFGVVTLVLVLLTQVAALAGLYAQSWAAGATGAVLAGLTARTALTLATRRGVPPARPEGLGAAVAGTVPVRSAGAVAAATVLVAALTGLVRGPLTALAAAASAALALGAAEVLLRHCRRRFGGVTGDVLGALAECAATSALLLLALG
ncbi:adenosylcobinamide-GDP ribazoletransferase [Streptomyces sp. JJ36]|uniref:adenosylcobinamide-GDP ribazoletransferase n=1 Tax=Streptomyces sp. JJ36 TaxID=2736645 RepID=UPI001F1BEE09|nr:adenosylcobinamide-GDP ribazoletransferase [Streptomyces sp. JJ36]MCF6525809.1 adenosylcobinamide-GDP ribazoletransferase [Streptomyces sp. JJ36]